MKNSGKYTTQKCNGVSIGVVFLFILLFIPFFLDAQEESGSFGFGDTSGFGFEENGGLGFTGGGGSTSSFSVSIGGEVSAELTGFFDDFSSARKLENARLGDIFSGSLNFEASGSAAQGVINLTLTPVFDSPVKIDEAYVRAFFGPVTVEGGIRKITWGKADSFGPMDVVNPLDYTDLTKLSDPASVKMGRPLIRAAWALGSFTKLEAVFVPTFQGHKFATKGRWTPSQIRYIPESIASYITEGNPLLPLTKDEIQGELEEWIFYGGIDGLYPDTSVLKYAQAGARFTTTIGSSDLGFQYYFGRLPRPVVEVIPRDGFITLLPDVQIHMDKIPVAIDYNYYHQIAVDFAQVIADFNLRAEAGINLTKDLDGSDEAVENPAIVWSLGFDRELFWGITFNLQGTGSLRLFHDKVSDDFLLDCEAGTSMSSTRITGILSRKFLRDELEIKVSGLWGIEDRDFLIIPALIWSRNDISAEIAAGFFGGDKDGELGQYGDNGYVRIILSYKF